MTLPARNLRLLPQQEKYLDRMSHTDGVIYYDKTNQSLRLQTGEKTKLMVATREWATPLLAAKAPLENPSFTGTVSGITAEMVGLGNVTNESKATMFADPTFTGTVSGVTAAMVGLGNVTNESKLTMFTNPTFIGTVKVESNIRTTVETTDLKISAGSQPDISYIEVENNTVKSGNINLIPYVTNGSVNVFSTTTAPSIGKLNIFATDEPTLTLSTTNLLHEVFLFNSYGNIGLVHYNSDPAVINKNSSSYPLYYNAGGLNANNAYTELQVNGNTKLTLNSAGATVTGNLSVTGDLLISGDTVTLNTSTLLVEDKNIELGKVVTPTDVTADGGGITLYGTTPKTLIWNSNAWNSSENFNLSTGKEYQINGASLLSATTLGSSVIGSSLTSVGTLSSLSVSGNTTVGDTLIVDTTLNAVAIGTDSAPIAGDPELYVNGDIEAKGRVTTTNLTVTGSVDLTLPALSSSSDFTFYNPVTFSNVSSYNSSVALELRHTNQYNAQTIGAVFYGTTLYASLQNITGNQAITSPIALSAATAYELDLEYTLVTTGTTSHTEAVGFTYTGSMTSMEASTVRTTLTGATASTVNAVRQTTITVTTITAALTTAQTVRFAVRATMLTNAAGNLSPVIAFSAAPGGTSTVNGLVLRIRRVGTTNTGSSGIAV